MLGRAFVVTLAAAPLVLGCDKTEEKTVNPPPPRNPPALDPSPSAKPHDHDDHGHVNPPAASASADPTKKKRAVRDPLPKTEAYGKRRKTGEAINPRYGKGRTIYARQDGHCYVRLPPAVDAPKPKTAHPPPIIQIIDCPPAMIDPAWDTCLNGRMRKLDDDCYCNMDGNPPPPPQKAECPKT